jgi:hypothetical protein
MAVELIITSVRKGLDGGSGYQPVLRTKDLKPPVAERLQLRSGYSHPFPHGDRRNPVVHVHRIERVAGETLHVIARICDAGSDHTGRSNFLAHFVAMDEAEARRKPAGPAEVMRRMSFKTSWDEPAREADPPTVVGGDRQPGPCQAWKAAGLDPGIAGDLAEAAMSGREVTLVSRESDDVLALFADALALVAPAKRWQVTFNTCRIEPFDGTWQAIRHDLPQAGGLRSGPGVIDLTTNPRGGNGPYAAFARGEAASLPWQQSAKGGAAEGEREAKTASIGLPPQAPRPDTAAVGAPLAGGVSGPALAQPRPKRRPGIKYVEPLEVSDEPGHLASIGRRLMWLVLGIVVMLPLAFGGVVYVWPDVIRNLTAGSSVASVTPNASHAAPSTEDLVGEAERAHREREKARMAEQRRNEQKQQEEAKAAGEATAQAAEAKRLEDETQRADSEAEKQKREQEEKRQRAAAALAALRKMPAIVVEDLVTGGGLGTPRVNDVDLGPFDIAALAEPGFALAVPKDVCDGAAFNAWVEEPPAGQKSWRILAASRAIDGGAAGPLHLATLTARDGKLYLRAVDDKAAKNPRFNLLRRSVLLVKARDPAEPSAKATVQRAIQLVRPVEGILQWEVSLLKKERFESLPRVPDTTVAGPGSSAAPALANDTRIAYEVRFDYPLQYQGGEPLEKPAARRFQASGFCPLLECSLPNLSGPQKPTVGVDIDISLIEGKLAFRPDVQGPGKDAVDLREIAEWVGLSDREFEKYFDKTVMGQLSLDVNSIKRQPLRRFPASSAYKKMQSLIDARAYRPVIDRFFVEQQWFLPSRKPNKEVIPDGKDSVQRWIDKCTEIINRAAQAVAANDNDAIKKAEAEWQTEMVNRLDAWLQRHRKTQYELCIKQRLNFRPLTGPVTIVVTELSSPAYDKDGKRYDVTLATPLEKNAGGSRPGRTPVGLD